VGRYDRHLLSSVSLSVRQKTYSLLPDER
jgi:hypothetical protein